MKIEKEIFSAATDSRFLREVTKHLTLDTEFANNLSLAVNDFGVVWVRQALPSLS